MIVFNSMYRYAILEHTYYYHTPAILQKNHKLADFYICNLMVRKE